MWALSIRRAPKISRFGLYSGRRARIDGKGCAGVLQGDDCVTIRIHDEDAFWGIARFHRLPGFHFISHGCTIPRYLGIDVGPGQVLGKKQHPGNGEGAGECPSFKPFPMRPTTPADICGPPSYHDH